jgi:hypothetical protein
LANVAARLDFVTLDPGYNNATLHVVRCAKDAAISAP